MNSSEAFELLWEETVPEVKGKAFFFRHRRNGAQVLSIENDDENKVFGITFRTPPADGTGAPHILEHAVLCGSRKYPVKEPFVELLKGSLKTFLNAMTYPDKTCYPVASQNLRDLRNLTDVYLDAVFYPLITPQTLQQEGWHYEVDGPEGSLRIVGVVYNEMKGSYSSPDRLLAQYSQESLFPVVPYGLDSGGHPSQIPHLTYEAFRLFHRRYYHPSNGRVFFYGDDRTQERLCLLDEYLKDFDPLDPASEIPLQPRFSEPVRLVRAYDPGQAATSSRTAMVTVNWLLPETLDPNLYFAATVLAHILIGTPASPLRKALIDSGLGEDLAGVGLENELRQMYLSTGLKGTSEQDATKIEELILETLESLSREGISPKTVEASLNTVEFRLRENNTGSYPRGLALMLRALSTWLYDGDPLAPLRFEAPFSAMKKRAAEGGYFEAFIREWFLENPHRTTLTLRPEPGLFAREEAAEKERLSRIRAGFDADRLRQIQEEARRLREMQEAPDPPEALASIPTLKLSDLPRENRKTPCETEDLAGSTVLFHEIFTSGIVYLDLGMDLHVLDADLLPYIPLFGRALLEMGTDKEDFVSLLQRIGRTTGGIHPTTFVTPICGKPQAAARLFLRGKAMADRAGDLLEILRDLLLSVRLDDQERFRQMVLEEKAGLEANVVPAGHGFVGVRLGARFHEAGWVAEQTGGISYLFFLRRLAEDVDRDWPKVLEALDRIRRTLVAREGLLCNVTADLADWKRFRPGLQALLEDLPSRPAPPSRWEAKAKDISEGLAVPSQVNFVGKAANLYSLGYLYHGSALAITRYLRTTWLWEKIRVQGGAYGGFCSFERRSGVFSFLSYRDPNLLATLRIFDDAGRFLTENEPGEQNLVRSIIGAIGELDAHELPDAKGFSSMARYLAGDSDEERQRMREELLSSQSGDFRAFGGFLDALRNQGKVVLMGSREVLEEAGEAQGVGPLEILQVL